MLQSTVIFHPDVLAAVANDDSRACPKTPLKMRSPPPSLCCNSGVVHPSNYKDGKLQPKRLYKKASHVKLNFYGWPISIHKCCKKIKLEKNVYFSVNNLIICIFCSYIIYLFCQENLILQLGKLLWQLKRYFLVGNPNFLPMF